MKTAPLCKDCKHCRDMGRAASSLLCAHPDAITDSVEGFLPLCRHERNWPLVFAWIFDACGASGRRFEPGVYERSVGSQDYCQDCGARITPVPEITLCSRCEKLKNRRECRG